MWASRNQRRTLTGACCPQIILALINRMNLFVSDASLDRKSTRLNSSHSQISYAVFCLKKKNTKFTICSTTAVSLATVLTIRNSPATVGEVLDVSPAVVTILQLTNFVREPYRQLRCSTS